MLTEVRLQTWIIIFRGRLVLFLIFGIGFALVAGSRFLGVGFLFIMTA